MLRKRRRDWNSIGIRQSQGDRHSGFTLIEVLVVIIFAGVLAAIAAPGWLSFLNKRRISTGIGEVHSAIQKARSEALRTKRSWQASFRDPDDGPVQWAVHRDNVSPENAVWQDLPPQLTFGDRTTLRSAGGVRRVRFNHRGWVRGQLGRITLTVEGEEHKRCVFVSTLLGNLRQTRGDLCES